MTQQHALQTLVSAAAQARLTAQEHALVQQAAQTLNETLTTPDRATAPGEKATEPERSAEKND